MEKSGLDAMFDFWRREEKDSKNGLEVWESEKDKTRPRWGLEKMRQR